MVAHVLAMNTLAWSFVLAPAVKKAGPARSLVHGPAAGQTQKRCAHVPQESIASKVR